MLGRVPDRKPRILAGFLCAALLFTLAPQPCAQQVSPTLLQAAKRAYLESMDKEPGILPEGQVEVGHQRQEPAEPALARGDAALIGKEVKVVCRDGRVYKGRLIELTPDSLRLQVAARIETFLLTDVATVTEQPGVNKALLATAIVGLGAALLVLFVVRRATSD